MKVKELHFDCYIENKDMIELAKNIGDEELRGKEAKLIQKEK